MRRRSMRRRYLLTVLILPGLYLGAIGCSPTAQPDEATVSAPADDIPSLIAATLAGHTETVSSLLRQGSDPNIVHNTNIALTYAARDGHTEIAGLLVDYGADVNWIDGEGVTPLILAAFKDHIEIVTLLLNHEADRTVRDQWDRTALDYALRRGPADPIAQLLKSAAN